MQDHLQKSWSDPKGPRRRRIYTTLQQGVQASPSASGFAFQATTRQDASASKDSGVQVKFGY